MSKELAEHKKQMETPRTKYKSIEFWRSLYEESMDELAGNLAKYIDDNIVLEDDSANIGCIPMNVMKFEQEIDIQLRTCLEKITRSPSWSARRAKEISLGIETSFTSFGEGVGLMSGENVNQKITSFVMSFIMCALKTSSPCGESIDAIPIVPCECCGFDMPLYWKCGESARIWRVIDICDDCELLYEKM